MKEKSVFLNSVPSVLFFLKESDFQEEKVTMHCIVQGRQRDDTKHSGKYRQRFRTELFKQ